VSLTWSGVTQTQATELVITEAAHAERTKQGVRFPMRPNVIAERRTPERRLAREANDDSERRAGQVACRWLSARATS